MKRKRNAKAREGEKARPNKKVCYLFPLECQSSISHTVQRKHIEAAIPQAAQSPEHEDEESERNDERSHAGDTARVSEGLVSPSSALNKHSSKLPAGHELMSIKDSSSLFRSSSFKLQV